MVTVLALGFPQNGTLGLHAENAPRAGPLSPAPGVAGSRAASLGWAAADSALRCSISLAGDAADCRAVESDPGASGNLRPRQVRRVGGAYGTEGGVMQIYKAFRWGLRAEWAGLASRVGGSPPPETAGPGRDRAVQAGFRPVAGSGAERSGLLPPSQGTTNAMGGTSGRRGSFTRLRLSLSPLTPRQPRPFRR